VALQFTILWRRSLQELRTNNIPGESTVGGAYIALPAMYAKRWCYNKERVQGKGGGLKIKVVVHEAKEGGYWGEVPAIPGCATQGETMEELLANVHEAFEACLVLDSTHLER
jgi:predicted RNase H-like HicB family nuclease